MEKYRANGKLLLSGEYAVLDGAKALAIPTRFGQNLEVIYKNQEKASPRLLWQAFLLNGKLWFSAEFDLNRLSLINCSNSKLAIDLLNIFQAIHHLNPYFFVEQNRDVYCKTHLEFPENWGLGSSSTLVDLLAQFSRVNPFELNDLTFKTSGYDVACASINYPILYQIYQNKPIVEEVVLKYDFLDHLYFVYLNQKQDTQINVSKNYQNLPKDKIWIDSISQLTNEMIVSNSLSKFNELIDLHEELISSKLGFPKVKDLYFSDFSGTVKSLGAWGGDFILLTSLSDPSDYLISKGYSIFFKFEEMINH